MSRDFATQFVDTEMDESAVDDLLRAQGYGILSLCDDGVPYSIPVSFGYDGDVVYVPFLLTDDDATKTTFVEAGECVRLLVTDIDDRHEWQSVSVTDEVAPVDPSEWDHFIDTLVANALFERGFEAGSSVEVQGWKLGLGDARGVERRSIRYE